MRRARRQARDSQANLRRQFAAPRYRGHRSLLLASMGQDGAIEESVRCTRGVWCARGKFAPSVFRRCAATLRRAHAVHPDRGGAERIFTLHTQREIAVIETCLSIGATFVAFSPLARGFLAGALRDVATLEAKDIRRAIRRDSRPGHTPRICACSMSIRDLRALRMHPWRNWHWLGC